jgi:L-2-hydroxyglutarate oxidase LhgO
MVESVDTLVVGAGVVGLAIARQLAREGHETLVMERGERIGAETSSRNSEVIHAGIYYPPGSLKARLCVEGRELLYNFCATFDVPHKRTGKFIVATSAAERAKLGEILTIGKKNGVNDLELMPGGQIARQEPEVSCIEAIFSPSTGIIDSGAFMLALLGDLEAHGGAMALKTEFLRARIDTQLGCIFAFAASEGAEFELACRNMINAAGHGAHAVAARIGGFPGSTLPPRFLAKGSYCSVSGRSPFRRLIYPVPVPGALGIHVTLDMNGGLRLGPDITWTDAVDYSVADDIGAIFKDSCRKFWPGVQDRDVTPSYCGIRPKIHGPAEGFADFRIDGPATHGVRGLINLFGIESPGLTSSLAIARAASQALHDHENQKSRP